MLRLPRFEHREVETIDELLSALDKHRAEAKVIAGGTDLLPRMKHRVVHAKYILNLKGLSRELSFVSLNRHKELRIGALTTLAGLENSSLIRRDYPMLLQAVRGIGSNQIRNMGTIGGNICLETRCLYYNQSHRFQFIAPCYKRGGELCYAADKGKKCFAVCMSDTAPVLISMEAKVVVKSKETERTVPLENIYAEQGAFPLKIGTNEIITEIILPAPNVPKGLFWKQTFRGSIEFGIASVALAVSLADRRITHARLVLGCISARPVRARKTEEILKGERISPAVIGKASETLAQEITFYPHHGNSATYVKNVSQNLLKSGLNSLRSLYP